MKSQGRSKGCVSTQNALKSHSPVVKLNARRANPINISLAKMSNSKESLINSTKELQSKGILSTASVKSQMSSSPYFRRPGSPSMKSSTLAVWRTNTSRSSKNYTKARSFNSWRGRTPMNSGRDSNFWGVQPVITSSFHSLTTTKIHSKDSWRT